MDIVAPSDPPFKAGALDDHRLHTQAADDARHAAPRHQGSGEIKAVGLFRALCWAREQNQIAEGKAMMAELHREGWLIVPIAPRQRRGAR